MMEMKNNSLLLLILSLAVFGIITTELSIIGLLPQLMSHLNINAAEVGLLISAYAFVVTITGPFITLLMTSLNKKYVLLGILLLFVVSNLVYAYTNNYSTMMLFRILPALMHAPFFAVTLVVASNVVAPEYQTKAAATVFSGIAVGLVLGVPLSSFIAVHSSLTFAYLFSAIANGLAFVSHFVNDALHADHRENGFWQTIKNFAQREVVLNQFHGSVCLRRHVFIL